MVKLRKDFLLRLSGIQCPHWTTIVLWTIGILVMTGLTVKDVPRLIMDYYDDDENTQVHIKVRPMLIDQSQRPRVFLTFPLANDESFRNFSNALHAFLLSNRSTACPECELMASRSFDVWTRTNMFKEARNLNISFEHTLMKRFLETLFNDEDKRRLVTSISTEWSRPILYALTSFLANASKLEVDFVKRDSAQPVRRDPSTPFEVQNAERLIVLYDVLVSFICEFLNMYKSTNGQNKNYCNDILRVSATAFRTEYVRDMYVLIIPLPLDKIDTVWIGPDYFDYISSRTSRFALRTETPSHGDDGYSFLYRLSDNDLEKINREQVWITYSLQSSTIEGRKEKLKTCYKESSRLECEWACQIQLLESLCECRTYSTIRSINRDLQHETEENATRSMPYCNSTALQACNDEYTYTSEGGGYCSDRCKEPCNSTSYQWQVTRNPSEDDGVSSFELQVLQRQQQSYLEFTMKVKDSPENLISQIGGVFNFYLGISGLSIIFFLIYLFNCWRRWRQLRMERQEREGAVGGGPPPPPIVADWRWRWMQLTSWMALGGDKYYATTVPVSSEEFSALKQRLAQAEDTILKMNEWKMRMEMHERMRTGK